MSSWTCNIGTLGRIIRGVFGLLAVAGGVCLLLWTDDTFWAIGLCTVGAFSLFEAAKGWCILRAAGIQLPF